MRLYSRIFRDTFWFSRIKPRIRCAFSSRLAHGPALLCPWSHISDPFTESWSEGSSALKIGRYYFIYYDHYRAAPQHETKRYEAVRSTDLKHWESINNEISFPKGCKQGSFLRLTQKEAERLQKADITTPQPK